ncbi:MAG: alpha/beta hydrolase [Bowdeniella nasicola]|nr:alpha/beta hydrolase [Bowdeniella nasicola]
MIDMSAEEFVPVSSGSLCVTRQGDPSGPLVLQLEGHRAQLISVPSEYLERLAAAGMNVVSVDNRDVGRSFHAARDYTLEEMAEDIHQLIGRLGGPAIVTGRSMGGAIAQLLALKHPDDVAGLGLFYTFALSARRAPSPPTPAPFLTCAEFIDYELEALEQLAGSRFPMRPDDIVELARAMWRRGVSWAGWERQRRAMETTEPWAHRLGEISVPTVVVHGSEDPVIPPEGGRQLAKGIEGADFHLIEGMGHQQPPELSDLFADLTLALVR